MSDSSTVYLRIQPDDSNATLADVSHALEALAPDVPFAVSRPTTAHPRGGFCIYIDVLVERRSDLVLALTKQGLRCVI